MTRESNFLNISFHIRESIIAISFFAVFGLNFTEIFPQMRSFFLNWPQYWLEK